jgi:hypothetical protein
VQERPSASFVDDEQHCRERAGVYERPPRLMLDESARDRPCRRERRPPDEREQHDEGSHASPCRPLSVNRYECRNARERDGMGSGRASVVAPSLRPTDITRNAPRPAAASDCRSSIESRATTAFSPAVPVERAACVVICATVAP